MIQLAPKKLCTGCGACAFVCGKNCIVMKENEVGIVYPELEMSNCVQCERCQKVCPIIENVDFRKPLTAYAAWATFTLYAIRHFQFRINNAYFILFHHNTVLTTDKSTCATSRT